MYNTCFLQMVFYVDQNLKRERVEQMNTFDEVHSQATTARQKQKKYEFSITKKKDVQLKPYGNTKGTVTENFKTTK